MVRNAPGPMGSRLSEVLSGKLDINQALAILNQNMQALSLFRSQIVQAFEYDGDYDRRMAESIARAVQTDGNIITLIEEDEKIATHDHTLAESLKSGKIKNLTAAHAYKPDAKSKAEEEFLSKLAGQFISERAGRTLMPRETLSNEMQMSDSNEIQRVHECVICCKELTWFDVFKNSCGHEYCGKCITELFERSYADESLFPPKCCKQTIPINHIEIVLFLPSSLRDHYAHRKLEVETIDRTYCYACNFFIRPSIITNHRADCPRCMSTTCSKCKLATHLGPCTIDPNKEALDALAKDQGWRKCDKCNSIIELTYGCNHMTCRCKHEFCYECGMRWKSCLCVRFEERRLLARAEVIVNRNTNNAYLTEAQRQVRVEHAARQIEATHECDHEGDWRKINRYQTTDGALRCEGCNQDLRDFILECSQCQLRACVRCRRNRF